MMSMSTLPEAPAVLLPQRPLTSLPTDRLSRNRQTLPAYRQATPSNRTSAQSRADSAIGSADSSKTTGSGKNGGVKMGRKTFYDDLDAGQVELTHQPEFVHMQTLTRGAVFGLQDLFKPDQPSLCVVSNGAECLLLRQSVLSRAFASPAAGPVAQPGELGSELSENIRNQAAASCKSDNISLSLRKPQP
uniref:Cyclic nucleotide-binding domain-containing protein n=1 Tax=Macrostomum lignano TaxID=282301 RepID=A0A1I8IJJ1_9PLAT